MSQAHLLPSIGMTLIMGQRSHIHQRMHALIVELALIGPVRLLIGGNRYDHYGINYALAAITSHYEHILDNHIRLSRAETCYQMVELLIETQANETPSLILDFLSVFYDESVAEREVNQLLFEAISALRRLSQQSMAVLSVHPSQNRPRLLKVLENTVDRIECPTAQYPEPISQHRLIR